MENSIAHAGDKAATGAKLSVPIGAMNWKGVSD